MGLIKAGIGALGGTLADQWKEFFYCDAMTADTLVIKGLKKTDSRSSNTKASENVISNGSGVVVADGQCAIIVEQGKVIEVVSEPGNFVYDTSIEPTIFAGNLGENVIKVFREMVTRFTYGGGAAKDQRIYYVNTKEIIDNKYGTPSPIPFRLVDRNIGLDMDTTVRCNGVYSFKIVNPILFYTNVTGNVKEVFTRDDLNQQFKAEIITNLQPALSKISSRGIRYNELPMYTTELTEELNKLMSDKWENLRGIRIVSFALNPVTIDKEVEDMIRELQKSAVMRDVSMAAATLTSAQADAMRDAANNSAGAMTGFMGFGMAQNSGSNMNTQNLYQMAEQQKQNQTSNAEGNTIGTDKASWSCKCGNVSIGNFCTECGAKKPIEDVWTCPSCKKDNKGKFCEECGTKKPQGDNLVCNKCGFKIDVSNPIPKFCPECGDIFDANDRR